MTLDESGDSDQLRLSSLSSDEPLFRGVVKDRNPLVRIVLVEDVSPNGRPRDDMAKSLLVPCVLSDSESSTIDRRLLLLLLQTTTITIT